VILELKVDKIRLENGLGFGGDPIVLGGIAIGGQRLASQYPFIVEGVKSPEEGDAAVHNCHVFVVCVDNIQRHPQGIVLKLDHQSAVLRSWIGLASDAGDRVSWSEVSLTILFLSRVVNSDRGGAGLRIVCLGTLAFSGHGLIAMDLVPSSDIGGRVKILDNVCLGARLEPITSGILSHVIVELLAVSC